MHQDSRSCDCSYKVHKIHKFKIAEVIPERVIHEATPSASVAGSMHEQSPDGSSLRYDYILVRLTSINQECHCWPVRHAAVLLSQRPPELSLSQSCSVQSCSCWPAPFAGISVLTCSITLSFIRLTHSITHSLTQIDRQQCH